MNQERRFTYLMHEDFVGRIRAPFAPSSQYETIAVHSPWTGEKKVLAAMHWHEISEECAEQFQKLHARILMIEKSSNDRNEALISALEKVHGSKASIFSSLDDAVSAFRLMSRINRGGTNLVQHPCDDSVWLVFAPYRFTALCLCINQNEEPPPGNPEWWSAALSTTESRQSDHEDNLREAMDIPIIRLPGEDVLRNASRSRVRKFLLDKEQEYEYYSNSLSDNTEESEIDPDEWDSLSEEDKYQAEMDRYERGLLETNLSGEEMGRAIDEYREFLDKRY